MSPMYFTGTSRHNIDVYHAHMHVSSQQTRTRTHMLSPMIVTRCRAGAWGVVQRGNNVSQAGCVVLVLVGERGKIKKHVRQLCLERVVCTLQPRNLHTHMHAQTHACVVTVACVYYTCMILVKLTLYMSKKLKDIIKQVCLVIMQ